MVVVGMTSNPSAATSALATSFDRHLLLTQPDHATRLALWNELVATIAGRELAKGEATILARLTEGLPAGYIQKAVENLTKVIFYIISVFRPSGTRISFFHSRISVCSLPHKTSYLFLSFAGESTNRQKAIAESRLYGILGQDAVR